MPLCLRGLLLCWRCSILLEISIPTRGGAECHPLVSHYEATALPDAASALDETLAYLLRLQSCDLRRAVDENIQALTVNTPVYAVRLSPTCFSCLSVYNTLGTSILLTILSSTTASVGNLWCQLSNLQRGASPQDLRRKIAACLLHTRHGTTVAFQSLNKDKNCRSVSQMVGE